MKQKIVHPWNISLTEAKSLQKKLSKKVLIPPPECRLYFDIYTTKTVAACDVSFKDGYARAIVIVLNYPDFEILEKYIHITKDEKIFPYIPGFLSFREGPLIATLLKKIQHQPDVIIFDGQGIAHPRKFGIATHIGVLFDIPSIGCAKNILYGNFSNPDEIKGSKSYIKTKEGEIVGVVLRTKSYVKPIFVSPGHKISIEDSANFILKCCTKFRIPEPLRIAHIFSKTGNSKHII